MQLTELALFHIHYISIIVFKIDIVEIRPPICELKLRKMELANFLSE